MWLKNAQKYGRLVDPINNDDHGAKGVNPCGEQTLWSYEMCNLTEVFLNRIDSFDDFLESLSHGQWVVVNAENYRDLNRFSAGLLSAVRNGKKFVFQCAASIVKSLSGIPDQDLLTGESADPCKPGFFIVGSHVEKTTKQLKQLLSGDKVEGIEVEVQEFLGIMEIGLHAHPLDNQYRYV